MNHLLSSSGSIASFMRLSRTNETGHRGTDQRLFYRLRRDLSRGI